MKITGGQAIVKALELEGVDTVFGYPGGAILPLYDSLRESNIHHVLVRHEQAAAHAASGYSRSSGKVGVCIATSGPGAVNLLTGIATAYMDSIPMVAITGQVPTHMIGQDAFQEADITGAVEPFCKHNYLVKNAEDIPRVMKEAFHIASTGRPGPVVIDIPKDVASNFLHFQYPDSVDLKGYKPNGKGHPLQVKRAAQAILNCKKPLICVGGGAVSSGAEGEILELAEKTGAPVATTLMGIGAFPGNHPLSLGMIGMHGTSSANRAAQESDLLIVLGARMADRTVGDRNKFGEKAIVVHIDIDPAEIGKNVQAHIPIVGDIKNTLKELLKYELHPCPPWWIAYLIDDGLKKPRISNGQGLCPRKILTELSATAGKDTIIVTDVGQHQIWTGQYYKVEKPRTFITSGGLGTMGYGLPAAIGAKMANPERNVLLITGDGSFQMNFPELATAVQEGLNVKILLMNNSSLGMVRELQQYFYQERYFSVKMTGNPDFIKLTEAYGVRGMRIEKDDEIRMGIERLMESCDIILGEFVIDPNENVTPVEEDEKSEAHSCSTC